MPNSGRNRWKNFRLIHLFGPDTLAAGTGFRYRAIHDRCPTRCPSRRVPAWPELLRRPSTTVVFRTEYAWAAPRPTNEVLVVSARETECPRCATALTVPESVDPLGVHCHSCGEMLDRRWYQEIYLKSSYWKATSESLKQLRGHCEKCPATAYLHVHHNGPTGQGYRDENGVSLLWREQTRPDLMQVLCKNHHRQAHGLPLEMPSTAGVAEPGVWVTPEDEWREFEQQRGLRPEGDLCDDCNVERVTCPKCDNERCPACGDGCTCDDEDEDDDDDDFG